MEEGVLQRVISICRQKSVSESQFAKMIGSNQKTINQQLRGERSCENNFRYFYSLIYTNICVVHT